VHAAADRGSANTFGVIGEREASLVRNAIIFAVDVKPMQMGITSPHENLNRVTKVGNAVVSPQEQSPPNHRANAAQDDLELGKRTTSRSPARSSTVSPRIALPKGFLNSAGELAPAFLCSP
jgi:hypothetical protein